MNILCLNTAFPEAHIALSFSGNEYFERIDSNSKHSENLLIAIEKIFERAVSDLNLHISGNDLLKQLDFISVVIGPGSFTGLRISIATAKALLAVNPNIKAVAINSLELIAHEAKYKAKLTSDISPVIDALSGLYFVSTFDKDLNCIIKPNMIEEKELKKYKNLVSNDKKLVAKENFYELNPKTLLKVAQEKIKSNDFVTENKLLPLYLRPSQAEANLKNANKN